MSYEVLAIAIPVSAVVLMVVFGRAVQRFIFKPPAVAGTRRRALDKIAALKWTLPPDYKFDRDEANERRPDKD
jgi:hypothetical protein